MFLDLSPHLELKTVNKSNHKNIYCVFSSFFDFQYSVLGFLYPEILHVHFQHKFPEVVFKLHCYLLHICFFIGLLGIHKIVAPK